MSEPSTMAEPGRRSLLVMLAVFAALAFSVSGASIAYNALVTVRTRARAPLMPDPQVITFLGPLAEGARFGGWFISRVEPPQRGRITLELGSESGERVTVDVHARARAKDAPAAIAETSSLAIYVRSGKGGSLTSEAAQRACDALADALEDRENAGIKPPTLEPLKPPEPPPI